MVKIRSSWQIASQCWHNLSKVLENQSTRATFEFRDLSLREINCYQLRYLSRLRDNYSRKTARRNLRKRHSLVLETTTRSIQQWRYIIIRSREVTATKTREEIQEFIDYYKIIGCRILS